MEVFDATAIHEALVAAEDLGWSKSVERERLVRALVAVRDLREWLDAQEAAVVARARKPLYSYGGHGTLSWGEIAEALGISQTAAHRRHSPG